MALLWPSNFRLAVIGDPHLLVPQGEGCLGDCAAPRPREASRAFRDLEGLQVCSGRIHADWQDALDGLAERVQFS